MNENIGNSALKVTMHKYLPQISVLYIDIIRTVQLLRILLNNAIFCTFHAKF